jgi:alpha-glucosidase
LGENFLGYRNNHILVVHNFGHEPINLPAGKILASSLHGMKDGHPLVADQTVWLLPN